jgi:hypothetical protein
MSTHQLVLPPKLIQTHYFLRRKLAVVDPYVIHGTVKEVTVSAGGGGVTVATQTRGERTVVYNVTGCLGCGTYQCTVDVDAECQVVAVWMVAPSLEL